MIKLQVCDNCQAVHYPVRDICPSCWQESLAWQSVSPEGRVSSFTELHVSDKAEWADKLPLRLGLVKLDAGPNILAFMSANATINAPVTLVFESDAFVAKERA